MVMLKSMAEMNLKEAQVIWKAKIEALIALTKQTQQTQCKEDSASYKYPGQDTQEMISLLSSFSSKLKELVAFDLLRDALSAIFGLSELKAWDAKDALGYILDCTLKDLDNNMKDEIEKVQRESIEIQEGMQKRINILENDTCAQTQGEINELIGNVKQKTYAYADVHAQNQDLFITISELRAKLKNVENGKSVNTKFDKVNVSKKLLYVTPLNKQVFQKKHVVPKTEEKHVFSKTITLQTLPNKQQAVGTNKNVIALGMYKVGTSQVTNTNKAKSVLSSTRLSATSSVRRPSNRDSSFRNSVVSNTKNSSEKVEVFDRTNKKPDVASKNVTLNTFVVQIVLWIVDSGCSKHMTGERSLLKNFVEKFMGTVRFGNDHFAAITSYGDYVQGDRESNLYTISIPDMAASSPVYLMSKASSTKS
ncbi:hypothetical protein Tco_0483364 [Tanacetum coccineum]